MIFDFFDSHLHQINDFNSNQHYNNNTKLLLLEDIQELKLRPELSPSFSKSLVRVENIIHWLYRVDNHIEFTYKVIILSTANLKWLKLKSGPRMKTPEELKSIFIDIELKIINKSPIDRYHQNSQFIDELQQIILATV